MRKNLSQLRSLRANQSGFTLVEIAIVLVIIGLLLGGVLKGQELIENGRVKAAANDFNGIMAAYNGYLDRYKRLPGDDGPVGTLTARGGPWATIAATGDNSGVIDAAIGNTFTGANESGAFFAHLRAAQFISGDPLLAGINLLPLNAWGGRVGVANGPNIQARVPAKLVLCMSNVPGKAALALDNQFDDGNPGAGSFQANAGDGLTAPAAAAAAAYVETTNYTVCRDM